MDKWTDGQMDGWITGQMGHGLEGDRQMDKFLRNCRKNDQNWKYIFCKSFCLQRKISLKNNIL